MLLFLWMYRLLSSLVLFCLVPLAPLWLLKDKYRARLLPRLGWGLRRKLGRKPRTGPVIWIHALSVGEVTSALPLVRSLREKWPDACLIFSATTRAGARVADSLMKQMVNHRIDAPLDLGPVVPFFIHCIRPDLFIQVETDFWPHWLGCLRQHQIPAMLVNGRVSEQSARQYRRFSPVFRPMFACFSLLSMQSGHDAEKMCVLGLSRECVLTLGNLKCDTRNSQPDAAAGQSKEALKKNYGFIPDAPLWICGSTHPGEETSILAAYLSLHAQFTNLQLLLAPRNIERSGEVVAYAATQNLHFRLRTTDMHTPGPLLLLDTIGELADCYQMADVAFVGGSLEPFGGHNPIEPAAMGVPVLVGPHNEDFQEIMESLRDAGALTLVHNQKELYLQMAAILGDPAALAAMGERAADWVTAHRGVVAEHLRVIAGLLAKSGRSG